MNNLQPSSQNPKTISYKLKASSGFTLIELLVVIAIIGVLSAIVITNLNSARGKGKDSSIKANLRTLQNSAQQYYDTNNTYGTQNSSCAATAGTLWSDTTIRNAIITARSSGGTITCDSNGADYAVSSTLSTGGNWCVDSRGSATSSTANTTTSICN